MGSVNSNSTTDDGVTVHSLLSGNELPRRERTILLTYVLDSSREAVLAHPELVVSADIAIEFRRLVERRLRGEPIAYLVGCREFFGLDLRVTPDVLIPRADTESLVEAALRRLPDAVAVHVLDLGSGSGAIAIALAKHRRCAQVEGVDISGAAVAIATGNARSLGLSNVEFHRSDWYSACMRSEYDIVVSNPPYIAAADSHLAAGDLRFEPSIALTPGEDGLAAIRLIVAGAGRYLTRGGWLLFEHGYDQAEASRELMTQSGFAAVASIHDLGGIERVCEGRYAGR